MKTKADYLQDLAGNPKSTVGQAAERLQAAEAAVSESYRRLSREKLVQSDKGQPAKYELTEAGLAKLRELQPPAEKDELQDVMDAVEESRKMTEDSQEMIQSLSSDVQELFRLLDEKLGIVTPEQLPADERPDEPQPDAATEELIVLLGLPYFQKRRSAERIESLETDLGLERSASAKRLAQMQRDLRNEKSAWWSDESRVREFEGQIAILRESLGLDAMQAEEHLASTEEN